MSEMRSEGLDVTTANVCCDFEPELVADLVAKDMRDVSVRSDCPFVVEHALGVESGGMS